MAKPGRHPLASSMAPSHDVDRWQRLLAEIALPEPSESILQPPDRRQWPAG